MKTYFININKEGKLTSSRIAQTDTLDIAKEIARFYKKSYPRDKVFITAQIILEETVVEGNEL